MREKSEDVEKNRYSRSGWVTDSSSTKISIKKLKEPGTFIFVKGVAYELFFNK